MATSLRTQSKLRCRLGCHQCGDLASFLHVETFAFALRKTGARVQGERFMRGAWVLVCPECDAYLLMQECEWAVPFYSPHHSAVIAIADYDQSAALVYGEFGNLHFTREALNGALRIVDQSLYDVGTGSRLLDRTLLGPTGIPDDHSASAEWLRQLEKLLSQLPERSVADLDAAAALLIRQVPNVSEPAR